MPVQVSPQQLVYLLVVVITSSADVFLPAMVLQDCQRDAWLVPLLAGGATSLLVLLYHSLLVRGGGVDFTTLLTKTCGRGPGRVLGGVYFLFVYLITSVLLSEIIQIISTVFLVATPSSVIVAVLLLLAAYAWHSGLKPILRVNELLFWPGILFRVVILLVSLPAFKGINYLPLLGSGIGMLAACAFKTMAWFSEFFLLVLLMPQVDKQRRLLPWLLGAVWAVVLINLVLYESIGVFGARQAAAMVFPVLDIIRLAGLSSPLLNLDAFAMTFWFGAVCLKVMFFYYLTWQLWQQVIPATPAQLLPLSVLLAVLPLLAIDETGRSIRSLTFSWPGMSFCFQVVVPCLLWVKLRLKAPGQVNSPAGS
ncbi:MAG: GerAB/ArcD/ProY family transporter [Desulfurispora sp.]|uniref:GerAB/ArcD/ProY family transporter n=1 Tax=Desulfurispora sp. TaxID=3014275 RepID=UPI00404A77EB